MSLLVKINRVESTINGAKKVTGLKLELSPLGPGPTNANTNLQDSKIELFEMPAPGDTATTKRLFATLSCQIKVDAKGNNPELDGNNASPTNLTYEPFVRGPWVQFTSTGVAKGFFWEAPDA